MTRYWRQGYWRTSVYGNVHWVEAHEVQRDEWGLTTLVQRNEAALCHARAHAGMTARLVHPNADCPVCGAPVFFYQNAAGSRVFFDELGPPWPKHPCTAQAAPCEQMAQLVMPTSERLRTQDEFDLIKSWTGPGDDAGFARRYGTPRWELAVYEGTYESCGVFILALNSANGYRYFIVDDPDMMPLIEKQLVTFNGSRVSFVVPSALEVREVKLRRVSAKRALHHVLGIEGLGTEEGLSE